MSEVLTQAPPEKKSKLLVIIAVVAVLAAVGVAAKMFLFAAPPEPEAADAPPAEGVVATLADMTTSIGGGATPGYVKLGLAAVLAEGSAEADLAERLPLMQDAALSELSGFSPDQLRSPEGIQQLRDRLTARAQEIWPDGEILRVVLTELMVQ